MIFITGGGGSDFVSFQISASLGKSSFSLVFFGRRVSGSRHANLFVSSESGITLLVVK